MNEFLKIGLIQTTLDNTIAWSELHDNNVSMSTMEGSRVWQEIQESISTFHALPNEKQAHIIVIPELSVAHKYEYDLIKLSKKTGTVIIAGLDFYEHPNSYVENKSIVIIPQGWPELKRSGSPNILYFGKTFFSYIEQDFFKLKEKKEYPHSNMYILEAGVMGRIGVAICSDFFDIERFMIYKGKIHHMIVISYNMDTKSYYFLAEAISRLVFCNVIICNTGFYGGSIVFSPYEQESKRYIYKHEGSKLFTSQILKVPVMDLDEEQQNIRTKNTTPKAKFKAQPPGYNANLPERNSLKVKI